MDLILQTLYSSRSHLATMSFHRILLYKRFSKSNAISKKRCKTQGTFTPKCLKCTSLSNSLEINTVTPLAFQSLSKRSKDAKLPALDRFIRWGSFSVFLQPSSLWNTTMCHRSLCWQHAPAFIPSSFSFCHSRLSCTALPHRILLQISLPSASLASLICCSVIAFQGQIYKSTSLCPFGSPWFHFMVSIPLFWSFAYGLLFIIICLSGS